MNDFRLVIQSLLFSFFPQLSFQRRINGLVNVTFSFVSYSFTTLSSKLPLKHNTVQDGTDEHKLLSRQEWQTKWRTTRIEVQIKTPINAHSTYNFSSSLPAPLAAIRLIFDLNFGSVSFYGTGQKKQRKTALGGVSG